MDCPLTKLKLPVDNPAGPPWRTKLKSPVSLLTISSVLSATPNFIAAELAPTPTDCPIESTELSPSETISIFATPDGLRIWISEVGRTVPKPINCPLFARIVPPVPTWRISVTVLTPIVEKPDFISDAFNITTSPDPRLNPSVPVPILASASLLTNSNQFPACAYNAFPLAWTWANAPWYVTGDGRSS